MEVVESKLRRHATGPVVSARTVTWTRCFLNPPLSVLPTVHHPPDECHYQSSYNGRDGRRDDHHEEWNRLRERVTMRDSHHDSQSRRNDRKEGVKMIAPAKRRPSDYGLDKKRDRTEERKERTGSNGGGVGTGSSQEGGM